MNRHERRAEAANKATSKIAYIDPRSLLVVARKLGMRGPDAEHFRQHLDELLIDFDAMVRAHPQKSIAWSWVHAGRGYMTSVTLNDWSDWSDLVRRNFVLGLVVAGQLRRTEEPGWHLAHEETTH